MDWATAFAKLYTAFLILAQKYIELAGYDKSEWRRNLPKGVEEHFAVAINMRNEIIRRKELIAAKGASIPEDHETITIDMQLYLDMKALITDSKAAAAKGLRQRMK